MSQCFYLAIVGMILLGLVMVFVCGMMCTGHIKAVEGLIPPLCASVSTIQAASFGWLYFLSALSAFLFSLIPSSYSL